MILTILSFWAIICVLASLYSSYVKIFYKCSRASILALSSARRASFLAFIITKLIFSSETIFKALICSSTTLIWLMYYPIPKAPVTVAPNATIVPNYLSSKIRLKKSKKCFVPYLGLFTNWYLRI